MAKEIWKFPLFSEDDNRLAVAATTIVKMPADSVILKVAEQYGKPYLWAIVRPGNPEVSRTFVAVNTGSGIPDWFPGSGFQYLDSVLLQGGDYVIHFFERINKELHYLKTGDQNPEN